MLHEYEMVFARPDGGLGLALVFAAEDDGARLIIRTERSAGIAGSA